MGIRLIQHAFVIATPQLGDHPRSQLAIIYMATIAHDKDDHPWYAGGWQGLAIPLGYHHNKPSAQRAAISRDLKPLIQYGFIERSWFHTNGRHLAANEPARWLLFPSHDDPVEPVDNWTRPHP